MAALSDLRCKAIHIYLHIECLHSFRRDELDKSHGRGHVGVPANARYTSCYTDLQTSCDKVVAMGCCRYLDVFAMRVPSCCDKSGTSCYHHLVARLMTVTDTNRLALQVVPTRLIQSVS